MRIRFELLFFSLLLFHAPVVSQTGQTSYTDSLCNQAFALVYNNPDSSRLLLTQAEKALLLESAPRDESKLYNYWGILYDVIGKYDSAFLNYQKALDIAQKNNVPLAAADALNNIGLLHWNNRQLDSALSYYYRALDIFEQEGLQKGEANVLSNLALIYQEQKRFNKSVPLNQKALDIRSQLKDSLGMGRSMANLSIAFSNEAKYDSAIELSEKAIVIFQKVHAQYDLATAYHDLATTYNMKAMYDSAMLYAEKALIIRRSLRSKKYIAATCNLLGRIHTNSENYKLALPYYSEALSIYEKYNVDQEAYQVHERLARMYEAWGKPNESLQHWKKRTALTDSLHQKQQIESLAEMEAKYETEKTKKELLRADKALLIEKRNDTLLYAGLIILILALLATFLILQQRLKQKEERKQKELLLQKMSISRDLHDNIGSQLTYLSKKLNRKSNGQFEHEKQSLGVMTNKALQDLRTTVWGLNSELTLKHLIQKIESEVQVVKTTCEHLDVRTHFTEKDLALPTAAVHIFRIVQEALQNAVKHADASTISISIALEDARLRMRVKDDGKGIDSNSKSFGFGLDSMKQRASKIGGTLKIDSSITGTEISLDLDTTNAVLHNN